MKNIFKSFVLVIALKLGFIYDVKAQNVPVQVLSTLIRQLQTGAPDPNLIGNQLWDTIRYQTNGSGFYPSLMNLGDVSNISVTEQQQLVNGRLYSMTAHHSNNIQSTWLIGISDITNKIEYAFFRIAANGNPQEYRLPSSTAASGSPQDVHSSPGCQRFPIMC